LFESNFFAAKRYCLPDNYEVLDASVNDIRAVLRPKYAAEDVKAIDHKMMYGGARVSIAS
jgi:U4/U6.U5 tri-snRNP-associated protein 2